MFAAELYRKIKRTAVSHTLLKIVKIGIGQAHAYACRRSPRFLRDKGVVSDFYETKEVFLYFVLFESSRIQEPHELRFLPGLEYRGIDKDLLADAADLVADDEAGLEIGHFGRADVF